MQTMAPPEEVLEERFKRIDERFDRVNERFDETNHRINEVDRRVTQTAEDNNRRFDDIGRRLSGVEATNIELRHQMIALNVTFQRGSFAIVASVLGVIAAILAKGG